MGVAPLGMLFEGQRTNLCLRSMEFDDASWLKSNLVTAGMANVAYSPDGTVNADQIIEDGTTGSHYTYQYIALADSTDFLLSVYAKKKAGRDWCLLQMVNKASVVFGAYFNLETGVIGSSIGSAYPTIQNVGSGWFRIGILGASGTGGATPYVAFNVVTGDGAYSYAGDGVSGHYTWGAQLEAGLFPSSYIVTSNASVTRNADTLTVQTSGNVNPALGSLFMQADTQIEGTVSGQGHALSFDDSGGVSPIYRHNFGTMASYDGSNLVQYAMWLSSDRTRRMSASWGNGYQRMYCTSLYTNVFDGSFGSGTNIAIGGYGTGASQLYGHIKNLVMWNVIVPASKMATMTRVA